MSPASIPNPFMTHKVDDTVLLPKGNVPELHADVLGRCTGYLSDAVSAQHGIGLLVVGQPGSGKSHLIAQFRHQIHALPRTVLAAIYMKGAFAGSFWRHVRERLVVELLRPYPSEHQAHGENGLMRILRNRFPEWNASARVSSGGIWEILRGKMKNNKDLKYHLDEFTTANDIDYAFQQVLPKVEDPKLARVANHWLRGKQLGEDDLKSLGLAPNFPSEQQQEIDSRNVVLSLLRLCAECTTLTICFDEVEAIQAGTCDSMALKQFAALVTDLVGESGPRFIATFIRLHTEEALRTHSESSNFQKIAQFKAEIPPITWEQTVRLTLCRLVAEPLCKAARSNHPANQYWPLNEAFLRTIFDEYKLGLTPRHLVRACAVAFERFKEGKSIEPIIKPDPKNRVTGGVSPPSPPIAPPPPPDLRPPWKDALFRIWTKNRKQKLEKIQGVQFDSVMGIGLPWLAELLDVAVKRDCTIPEHLGDVNLLFRSTASDRQALGISFCNHSPSLLWRRLDKLLNQWTDPKRKTLARLVVLRFDSPALSAAAQARMDALTKSGVQVIFLGKELLAELAAFQALFTAAQNGDITDAGKPIEICQYTEWAKENLTVSVTKFLNDIFPKTGTLPTTKLTSPPPSTSPSTKSPQPELPLMTTASRKTASKAR